MPARAAKGESDLFTRLQATGKLPALLRGLGVFLKDYEAGVGVPNTLWAELGYGSDELGAELWREILHPDDRAYALESWDRVYRGEADAWSGQFRIRAKDGSYKTVRHRTIILERGPSGAPSLAFGVDQDLSDLADELEAERAARLRAESALMRAELLRAAGTVASSALDGLEAVDRVIAQARSVLEFDAAFVWQPEDDRLVCLRAVGADPMDLPDAAGAVEESAKGFNPVISTLPFGSSLCLPLVTRSRVLAVMQFLSRRAPFGEESLRSALGFADSAAVALANALRFSASERLAATDWLTGLGTRRRFEERGLALLADGPACVSCLMVDIDHFKRVNDEHGHQAGDAVLRELGAFVRGAFRDADLVCRYGGEELVVLMPGACAKAAAEAAERVRSGAKTLRYPSVPDLSISVSVGAATLAEPPRTDPRSTLSTIVAKADAALYRAKGAGRDRVEIEN